MKLVLDNLTINSLEIADLVGMRHDNVKRTIQTLIDREVISLTQFEEVKIQRSRRAEKVEVFQFVGDQGKRDSLVVVAQLSPEFTGALVDRWMHLESRLAVEQQRKEERQAARLEAPAMTAALKAQRELEGKGTPPYIYSNDYNMINRIIFGMTTKQFREEHGIAKPEQTRDYLSPAETTAMLDMQRINTSLIQVGMPYAERKERLERYMMEVHSQALLDELHLLES